MLVKARFFFTVCVCTYDVVVILFSLFNHFISSCSCCCRYSTVSFQLEGASSYEILSSSGCITLEGVDDAERFKSIQMALSTMGVEDDAQLQVLCSRKSYLHKLFHTHVHRTTTRRTDQQKGAFIGFVFITVHVADD